ncbi:UNVERIFIED_CONTAM: Pheophorbide a oxygenase, chloroplastic [Sesamum radiatum]|uniref:Pheophorbide a oxygenase, chloroplastic n=1 Tax=Sesamum radiatum TaxID=300843 RepID=A0AAW2UNM3_SESRA
MVVSLASATPVFTSTTSSCSSAHVSLPPRFVCGVPSRRRRGLFKNPLRVAAPPSTPVTDISEGDQEKFDLLIETEGSEEIPSSKFSWRDHWYPVSLVEDLNPRYPTPFQLLNRDLVLWFDSSASEWVAFDDKCPHRLAPLSEGRIDENGHLQCSYHGWSFDGCGSCTRIPQAASEGPEARAVKSPRACATRFPTKVSQGLLFVWPDENGWERAQATLPPMLPDDFDKPEFSSVTIQRDLYYGYDTLMENVSDPSHIDFAHHKVVPRWHEHWTSNKVYDGDMIVLQGQEKIFLSQLKDGSGDINQQYTKITFTPTQADRFVLAFRNWLRRHGNSQPEWFGSIDQQPLPSTVLSKRQMLDRFEQHTQKCSSCRSAYTTFQTLQKFLIGATVVCAATAGIPPDMQIRIVLAQWQF